MPPAHAAKKGGNVANATRRVGKVVDRIATDAAGNRVTFIDKAYPTATHKVSISIPGHSLYSLPRDGSAPAGPPQSGFGLAPEDVKEIADLLSKNAPVTLE